MTNESRSPYCVPCPRTKDSQKERSMESQDIFILLKLTSLAKQEREIQRQKDIRVLSRNDQLEIDGPKKNTTAENDDVMALDIDNDTVLSPNDSWDSRETNKDKFFKQEDDWEGWLPDDIEPDYDIVNKYINPSNFASRYSVRGLAAALGISKTAINNSINRCIAIGLITLDRKTLLPKINTKIVFNLIVHGVKYVFPAEISAMTRGIPTSFASPALKEYLETAGDLIYVWPDPRGKKMGQSVTPLFSTVPFAVRKDRRLYEYLALVDAIRIGNAREVNVAKDRLEEGLIQL